MLPNAEFSFLNPLLFDITNKYKEDRDSIKKIFGDKIKNIDSFVFAMPHKPNQLNTGKIFSYNIVPIYINSSKDSIALFFKYSFDSLMQANKFFDYHYYLKLNYKFVVVPLNKLSRFDFIDEHLGSKKGFFIFSIADSSQEKLYSRFTTGHFDNINNSINESTIGNLKFGLSAEFIRSNLKDDNILIRQLAFPMEGADILRGVIYDIPVKLPETIYKSSFSFQDSINSNEGSTNITRLITDITYDIFLIPISYQNKELTFDLFIDCTKSRGGRDLSFCPINEKHIIIKKGESMKLNLIGGLFENTMRYQKQKGFENYMNPNNIGDLFIISFDSVNEL
jgi:hypothetical protein